MDHKMRGRPPKSKVEVLANKMDRIMPEQEVLEVLATLVRNGNTKAVQMWCNYRFGMPKQIVESVNQHTISNFNVKDLIKFDSE
jgi:hypothetical protein